MLCSEGFFRNARLGTVLLVAALGVSLVVGCRSPGGQPAAAIPETSPLVLLGSDARATEPLPEVAQAFRPITPEPLPSKTEAASVEPVLQKKIDDLNSKVRELEKKLVDTEKNLSEKEAELKHSLLPTPVPVSPKTASAIPLPPPVLPTIAIVGVTSVIDGDEVRIRIPDNVLFQPGTMQLTADGEDAIRTISAEVRTKYPNGTLDIEGHTDNLQTDPTNATQKHDLASLKSMVVVQYFIQTLQWKQELIATSARGSGRPIADNGTPEGRDLNNRIEIVVKDTAHRQ